MSIIRVIDLESTHPTPAEGGLVEIGFCDIGNESTDLAGQPINWIVGGGFGRLCNPGCNVPPETSAIHHLVNSDVEGLDDWKVLFARLLRGAVSTGDIIAYAAHGADFEKLWMHPDWMGPNPLPMIDTYKVALRVYQDAPGHSNQVLRYWLNSEGLDRATATPAHRAYPDAYVTAHTLRDMLNSGVTVEQMLEWSALPALTIRCYIGDYRNDGKGTPWPEVPTSMLTWILNKDFKEDVMFSAKHHLDLRIALDLAERRRDEAERAKILERPEPTPEPEAKPLPDLEAVPSEDIKI